MTPPKAHVNLILVMESNAKMVNAAIAQETVSKIIVSNRTTDYVNSNAIAKTKNVVIDFAKGSSAQQAKHAAMVSVTKTKQPQNNRVKNLLKSETKNRSQKMQPMQEPILMAARTTRRRMTAAQQINKPTTTKEQMTQVLQLAVAVDVTASVMLPSFHFLCC